MRYPELSRPAWLRYGIAAIVAAAAIAVTAIWWPIFRGAPFMPAFLALFVAGWFGGGGPSLLVLFATTAALLSARPFTELRLADVHDPTRIFLFLGVGAIASVLQFELWATKRARAALIERSVTDRRIAGEMSERLAAIVESSEDAIVGKSLAGTINAWNPAAERLFGYKAEEILGKSISVLMPPDHSRDMEDLLSRIRRGERVEHFETVRVTKSGRMVDVSLSLSPVKDGAGHIVGAAKIVRDIGERRKNERERDRLYREAREAARLREDFLSVAGHELRTPLTALQLQLHTLRKRIASTSPASLEALEKIDVQFRRLHQLTEELLDVTRIASGYLLLEPRRMDLSNLIREVADRHRETALRSGSEIRFEGPESVTGTWDSSRLDQVATNLLSNAVKFGRGGPIDVRLTEEGEAVRLTVEDQGIGIATKDQTKIFERFERAVSRRSYGGLGLGLWISREIVEAHGGRIRVESEHGTGSRFIVELPRVTTARPDPDPEEAAEAEAFDGASGR